MINCRTFVYASLIFSAGDDGNRFSIDADTGKIYAQSLDREQQERYTLTIQAADNGVPANINQTRVIITVSIHYSILFIHPWEIFRKAIMNSFILILVVFIS